MKKILTGESGTRDVAVNVEDKTVLVTHCWKKDKDATRYQLMFDYKFDVELKEVYRLAALWVNKDFQNRMRSENYTPAELEKQEGKQISVKTMYEPKERAPRDPKKAAESALGKLSPEEVAAILAKFAPEADTEE